jgi:hypothetical protein
MVSFSATFFNALSNNTLWPLLFMSDKAFEDNDASVYKTHILYVLPRDPNCVALLKAIEQHPLGEEVFVQDVGQLRQRPPWLDGVPILVNKKTNTAKKGGAIRQYLAEWEPEDFLPANSSVGGWTSYDDAENGFEKRTTSFHNSSLFALDADGDDGAKATTYGKQRTTTVNDTAQATQPVNEKQRRKQESEQISQGRAQALLDARQQQDQRLQNRPSGGGPVPRNAFSEGSTYAPSAQPRGPPAPQPSYPYAPPAQQYAPQAQQYARQAQQYAPQAQQYAPQAQQYAPQAQQYAHQAQAQQYAHQAQQYAPQYAPQAQMPGHQEYYGHYQPQPGGAPAYPGYGY